MPDSASMGRFESIHPGLVSVLSELEAASCITAATQGIYEGIITRDQYQSLGKDEQDDWHGHHIDRKLFDRAFLEECKRQGVQIIEAVVENTITGNGRVSGITTHKGETIKCSFVIDATGHKRLLGRKLGFRNSFYSPPLISWTGMAENIPPDFYFFKEKKAHFIPDQNGWTWLAPLAPDRSAWTRLEKKGKQEFRPPEDLIHYTAAEKIKKSNRRWQVWRPLCTEGVLLCGEAAGIIDPAAGQGILNAVVSAVMAAKTIRNCIRKPDLESFFLARYDDWYMNDYVSKVTQLKYFYSYWGIDLFA